MFFLSEPLTEIKKQQGVYPNRLKLSVIWRNFHFQGEKQKVFFLLWIPSKFFLRISFKSILLFSLPWSYQGEENWERAMRITLTGFSEKDFLDNEAPSWKWTQKRPFSNNEDVDRERLLKLEWAYGDYLYRL